MLEELPSIPNRRVAIRLTPDALRQVRGGHPWVYANAVTSVSDEGAEPGSLAVIFDRERRFAAIGLWDPDSPIRVRVLHAGAPTPIDGAFWRAAIERALDRRSGLSSDGTTGYRLLHGENDGFGGLIVDRYANTLVVKLYTAAWLPHLRVIIDALIEITGPDGIILRLGRLLATSPESNRYDLADGLTIYGSEPSEPVMFTENGLRFEADVLHGPKSGYFLDQRDNRQGVRNRSHGLDVLDLFSCAGGFSVYAAAGGARSVHSVDISGPSIDAAVRNFVRNTPATAGTVHRTTVGDAFEVMQELARSDERFDLVVIDPPSFASRASERSRALRAYSKLTHLALPLLRSPGRLVQSSCSSRINEDDLVDTVEGVVSQGGLMIQDSIVTGHAVDHPISFPQGQYLNTISLLLRES